MIRLNHSNRKMYNWLISDMGDIHLNKYSSCYKDALSDLGCSEALFKDFFLQYVDSYTGVDWRKTLYNSKADIVSGLNKKIELENEVADTQGYFVLSRK